MTSKRHNMTQSRAKIFSDFLSRNKFVIIYNGVRYTMVDKDDNIVIETNTGDELYLFILGYNLSYEHIKIEIRGLESKLQELEETNRLNVERYESIISQQAERLERQEND